MKNKLLLFIGSLLFVVLFGSIKVNAQDFSYLNNYVYGAGSAPCSYNGYDFNAPVAIVSSGYYYIICPSYTEFNNSGNHYYNTDRRPYSGYPCLMRYSTSYATTFSGIPLFNNFNDASLYSRGLSYNASAIVGGTVPISYTYDNDSDASIKFLTGSYQYTESYEGLGTVNTNVSKLWYNVEYEADLVPNFKYFQGNIYLSVPDKNYLTGVNNFINDVNLGAYIPDSLDYLGLAIHNVSNFMWDTSKGHTYNSYRWTNDFSYVTLLVPFTYDDSISGLYQYTSSITSLPLTANNNQLLNILSNYYNNDKIAFYVFNLLMRIDYMEMHQVGYDDSLKKYVAYKSSYYYPDKLNYDETVFQKQDVSVTPNSNIPSGNITENQFNNIGAPTNHPTLDNDTNTIINDKLNQIIEQNNLDKNNVTVIIQNMDDKWADFEDGELNVDEQISDVYSLAKSVAHISLLLGAMFNGWFPAWLVGLIMFAVAFIPIIIVIKFIRG